MTHFLTLFERVSQLATHRPDDPAFTAFGPRGEEASWTWAELNARVEGIAFALGQRVTPGARVMLLYPQGLEYIAALLGAMKAGVLSVPLQPPGKHRAKHVLPKLEAIADDGPIEGVLTISERAAEVRAVLAPSDRLSAVEIWCTEGWESPQEAPKAPVSDPKALAYLQYTSGSTSLPKGVMVSHENLDYNLHTFDLRYGHEPGSVVVSWLPTFHDLGLVYGVFLPIFKGLHGVLLDPLYFLKRPLRWLEAISRFRGTHSPSPNFAFELCVVRSTPEERAALDLRSWKVALNGAEPIRRDTEERFVEAFAQSGMRWETLSHAYGMSESTAVIAKEPVGTLPTFLCVDGQALDRHQVVEVPPEHPAARWVAGCGVPELETTVAAVHPDTRVQCLPSEVGELWVGGPTRAQGYFGKPQASRDNFEAEIVGQEGTPWLRTGDLGFVWEGEVYVTGRLKDLIILRGENYYPQDIEFAVQQCHPSIRPSCVAAFAVAGEGTEGLGVVCEVYPERVGTAEEVFEAIRQVCGGLGAAVSHIGLVGPRAVFKTSSGKIMRRRTRAALLAGELPAVAHWVATSDSSPLPPMDWTLPRFAQLAALEDLILTAIGQLTGASLPSSSTSQAFQELGVDSVGAVALSDRLTEHLGVLVDPAMLFDWPTPASLAAAIEPPQPEESAPEDLSLDDLAALLDAELESL